MSNFILPKTSNFELTVAEVLTSMRIKFIKEYSPSWIYPKRYDFYFTYDGRKIILEADGAQHFEFTPIFHSNKYDFYSGQQSDIEKTKIALNDGYEVIRIHHSHYRFSDIKEHILKGLDGYGLYVSNPSAYKYLDNKYVLCQEFAKTKDYIEYSWYSSNLPSYYDEDGGPNMDKIEIFRVLL